MLSTRQLQILKQLMKDEDLNIKDFVKRCNITPRMVHYEIDNINYYLRKYKIPEIDKKYGGTLRLDNHNKLSQLIDEIESKQEPSLQEKLVLLIFDIILMDRLDVSEFCSIYKIKHTSFTGILEKVKQLILEFSVELAQEDKVLSISAPEERLRSVMLHMLHIHFKQTDFPLLYQYFLEHVIPSESQGVSEFILLVQKDLKTVMSDEAFGTIQRYLFLMILRVKQGHLITSKENAFFLSQTVEYEIVQKHLSFLKKQYEISLPDEEVCRIVDFFMGSQAHGQAFSYYDSWVLLNETIRNIILLVENQVCLPISQDEDLYKGLMNHIKPTIHRLKNSINYDNMIHNEVARVYSDLYSIISTSLRSLEDMFQVEFPPDEVSFLVIHFKASIDKMQAQTLSKKKNILIVCGLGFGVSMFLSQQIARSYDVNIKGMIPLYLVEQFLGQHPQIEYIVTTLDMDERIYGLPVIKINPFLKEEDFSILDQEGFSRTIIPSFKLSNIIDIISKHADIKNISSLTSSLQQYFHHYLDKDLKCLSEEQVFFNENLITYGVSKDWQSTLQEAGALMYHNNIINMQYVENIIETIDQLGSYMVANGVAYPHSRPSDAVKKTGFGLLILDKCVEFPNKKMVDIVLIFASKDGKEHIDMLIALSEIMQRESFRRFLKGRPKPQLIYEYCHQYL